MFIGTARLPQHTHTGSTFMATVSCQSVDPKQVVQTVTEKGASSVPPDDMLAKSKSKRKEIEGEAA